MAALRAWASGGAKVVAALGAWAGAKSARAASVAFSSVAASRTMARIGVGAAGGFAVGGLVGGGPWQVQAPGPTLRSIGRPAAAAELGRWAN